MKNVSLITGFQGQDGQILCDRLLERGYTEVVGLVRPGTMKPSTKARVVEVNLTQASTLKAVLHEIKPSHIYHLASIAVADFGWETPASAIEGVMSGVTTILEYMMESRDRKTRLVYASSREIFGDSEFTLQNESTQHAPKNIYGLAKSFSQNLIALYRQRFQLHCSTAILYNHESELRRPSYLTGKICAGLLRYIHTGVSFSIGSFSIQRDWGWAEDFMDALILMVESEQAEDYIVASGTSCSIREFLKGCLKATPLHYEFIGVGLEEKLVDSDSGAIIAELIPGYSVQQETRASIGDISRIKAQLGWQPNIAGAEVGYRMMQKLLEKSKSSNQEAAYEPQVVLTTNPQILF
jgi:GDPmannose 4,6-dehydratase